LSPAGSRGLMSLTIGSPPSGGMVSRDCRRRRSRCPTPFLGVSDPSLTRVPVACTRLESFSPRTGGRLPRPCTELSSPSRRLPHRGGAGGSSNSCRNLGLSGHMAHNRYRPGAEMGGLRAGDGPRFVVPSPFHHSGTDFRADPLGSANGFASRRSSGKCPACIPPTRATAILAGRGPVTLRFDWRMSSKGSLRASVRRPARRSGSRTLPGRRWPVAGRSSHPQRQHCTQTGLRLSKCTVRFRRRI
jgi:hypothetical protein